MHMLGMLVMLCVFLHSDVPLRKGNFQNAEDGELFAMYLVGMQEACVQH
jgi:hypothetical protein